MACSMEQVEVTNGSCREWGTNTHINRTTSNNNNNIIIMDSRTIISTSRRMVYMAPMGKWAATSIRFPEAWA